MTRTYDASRRLEAANRTRQAILAAAFRLHGQGNLDMEALAREADVSVATVRKHFPNRELLFEGCSAYGLHAVPAPDFQAIATCGDPVERAREAVRQVLAFHEALLGQVWTGYLVAAESPATTATLRQINGLGAATADLILSGWEFREDRRASIRGFVLGMLSPLAYRALRIDGGLSPEDAVAQASRAVVAALLAGDEEGEP